MSEALCVCEKRAYALSEERAHQPLYSEMLGCPLSYAFGASSGTSLNWTTLVAVMLAYVLYMTLHARSNIACSLGVRGT